MKKYFICYTIPNSNLVPSYIVKNKIISVHPLKWVEKTSFIINWWKKLEEDEIQK